MNEESPRHSMPGAFVFFRRLRAMTHSEILTLARQGLAWQRSAIDLLSEQLEEGFIDAARSIAGASKVVATGLGKSGFIARKMAATLTSVHIPGVYLHPVDALHGDIGMLEATDVLIAFSKSGETPEVVYLTRLVRELNMKVISITCRSGTTLGSLSDHALVAPILHELDPLNLLPTASTTQSLILADLLSVTAANINGDIVNRLQRSHPHGGIGIALLRNVEDVMHSGNALPRIASEKTIAEAVYVLTSTALGIVCVIDEHGALEGILTDGDVRRLVGTEVDLSKTLVRDVMTKHPVVVQQTDSLHTALQAMEARERQISVVPVVRDGRCVGVVRVHDIIRAQL